MPRRIDSTNASRTSFNTDQTKVEGEANERGSYGWCGTKDGCLFELDVMNGGKLVDVRVGAHTGHVTSISKLKGNLMLSSGHAAANPIIGEWKLAQTNCNAMTRII